MGVRSPKPKAPALPKTNVTRYAKHTDAVFVRFMIRLIVSGDVVFLKKGARNDVCGGEQNIKRK